MTRIRSQLRSARQAYAAARYPGDLAAELLPRRALAGAPAGRRRAFLATVGAGAAAALLLALLFRPEPPGQRPAPPAPGGALVDRLPVAPGGVPLPRFQPPALPLSPPELRLPTAIPPGVETYQDLAMRYRQLQVPESLRHTTVPSIPADLPSRGVDWLHKVWTGEGDKSA